MREIEKGERSLSERLANEITKYERHECGKVDQWIMYRERPETGDSAAERKEKGLHKGLVPCEGSVIFTSWRTYA